MIFLQTYLLNIPTKPPAVYATQLPQQLNPCHKCDGSVSYKDKLVTRKEFRSMLFHRRICCSLEGLEIEQRSIFFLWKRYFFCLVTSVKQKKFWVPRRNRTSDLRIPRSDAIPQRLYSKQGLLRSSYMTCVLHNASLRIGPSSPWNLCGSVVEHQSAESAGLTCDSSKRLRIFPLSHARDMTKKLFSLFLYRAQNLPSFLFYFFLCFLNRNAFLLSWCYEMDHFSRGNAFIFSTKFKWYEVNIQISLTQKIAVIIHI